MKLELEVIPVPALPALAGAHKLAWAYMLDVIFAEMYHAKVGRLHLTLPSKALVPEVKRRAALSRPLGEEVGVALLGPTPVSTSSLAQLGAKKLFTLSYGQLAPERLKAIEGRFINRQAETLYVLTWRVKLLGLAMSVLNRWRTPRLADLAMFAMRHAFASSSPTFAYYQLHAWTL